MKQKCILLISLHVIIDCHKAFEGFALETRHFRVPETPSHAVFPREVAKKYHSAGTQKSATGRTTIATPFQFQKKLLATNQLLEGVLQNRKGLHYSEP